MFKEVQADIIKYFPKTVDVYRKINKFLTETNIDYFNEA